jgi:hypothetical protein
VRRELWLPRKQRTAHTDGVDQILCLTSDGGHVWIHYYDRLPPIVRKRLREAAVNVCPACLVCTILPEVKERHPDWSNAKALLASVDQMQAMALNADPRKKTKRIVS